MALRTRGADWHHYHDFIGCTTFPLNVLQLVYPDHRGRFPGDEGCDPQVARCTVPARSVAWWA